MARKKCIIYNGTGMTISGRPYQGLKCYDSYTSGVTYSWRMSADDYGVMVDDAKYDSGDVDPKR